MTYEELSVLAREHGSPFYIFDSEAFTANVRDMVEAFIRHYPRTVLGYSYKTNYIPYICELAQELGAYAEVVSRLELDLALRIDCKPSEIIFNGPMKTKEDIDFALSNRMILHLDTLQEMHDVLEYSRRNPEEILNIGLRLNIVLVDDHGNSHLYDGLATGRFGLSPQDVEAVARQLREWPNIRVTSLHGHVSSTTRSLWGYRVIARTLADTAARHFPATVANLDIGGGFYGRRVPAMGLDETPTYDDYAKAVALELLDHPWVKAHTPRLIIEPGLAVVADTMSFVTRVFDLKQIGSRRLAVVDGTYFNVKPTLHRRNHPFEHFPATPSDDARQTMSVVGATCMEKDCLLQEVESAPMKRGDFISIGNVGAYSVVLTPPFIQPAPAVVTRGSQGWMAIRRRQEFDDFFNTYEFRKPVEAQ